ncbi:hypothetical protein GCM10023264_03160 [Sphingomonas daechungensis]
MIEAGCTAERKAVGIDTACILLLVLISAAPYVASVGFYSDDWGLVGEFLKGRTSFADLLGDYPGRPVQGAYILLLFKVFGLNPLGYHLINTAVIALCALALYLLLLRLDFRRPEAFATVAVFTVLPQLSTIRVWVATVQVPLSMLAALASMHAQTSFLRTGRWPWIALAVACAAISALSYEIFAPLIVAFPVGLVVADRQRKGQVLLTREKVFLIAITVLTIMISVLVKMAISDRMQPLSKLYPFLAIPLQAFDPGFDWRTQSGPNLFAGIDVYGFQTLRGWGNAISSLLTGQIGLGAIGAGIAIGGLTTWRMWNAGPMRPAIMAVVGLATFLLGHAVFLVLGGLLLSPTGLSNRVTMAAAPGLAMIFVAAMCWVTQLSSERIRGPVMATTIGLVVAVAMLRISIIESYWVDASRRQQQILTAAKRDLAGLPQGSTIILGGVCPYAGPGVVFETYWDVGPALSIILDRQISGDIATDRTRSGPIGLETSLYGELTGYPYGLGLFGYQPDRRRVVRLTNPKVARAFLSESHGASCPRSYPGQGELI